MSRPENHLRNRLMFCIVVLNGRRDVPHKGLRGRSGTSPDAKLGPWRESFQVSWGARNTGPRSLFHLRRGHGVRAFALRGRRERPSKRTGRPKAPREVVATTSRQPLETAFSCGICEKIQVRKPPLLREHTHTLPSPLNFRTIPSPESWLCRTLPRRPERAVLMESS